MVDVASSVVGETGDYVIVFKSGATVTLSDVELVESLVGNIAAYWYFTRGGKVVSFGPHVKRDNLFTKVPLDEVVESILRIR